MDDLRKKETLFSGKAGHLLFYIVVVPDELFGGCGNALCVVKVVGLVKSRMETEAQPVAVGGEFCFVAIGEFFEHEAAVLVAFEQIEQKFGLIFVMQFFQIGEKEVVKDGFGFAGSIVFEQKDGVVNKETVFFHNSLRS